MEENEDWTNDDDDLTEKIPDIIPDILPVKEEIDIATVCLKGGQFYPHPDPTKFIHCAHGWPFIKDCPQGQIWINEKQWCDYGSVPVSSATVANTIPTKVTVVTTRKLKLK